MKFSFIDLFSGIGGFRVALEKAGGHCVAFSEIDNHAINTYRQNFETSHEVFLGDITKCETFPYADLIVGGVPCQAWSIAGKNRGFDDERGKLWFDAIKSVASIKPKAFIFENVKGLQDPRNIDSLYLIVEEFKKLKYEVKFQVLNASDYGLPQNRERLFIVGIRSDIKLNETFSFPQKSKAKPRLFEVLDDLNHLKSNLKNDGTKDFFVFCDTRNGDTTIHSWDLVTTTKAEKKICLLILNNRRKSKYGSKDGNPISFKDLKKLDPLLSKSTLESLVRKRILRKTNDNKFELVNSKNSSGINDVYRIYLPESSVYSTLTATGTKDFIATESFEKKNTDIDRNNFIEKIVNKGKFRQISSREAARLQGFPESFKFHKNYKSSIKQFGNAVPVHVISALINSLIKTGCFK